MITQLWLGERQNRRRKEHCFIIRVCDQQTDPLVVEPWEVAREGRRRRGREGPEEEDCANSYHHRNPIERRHDGRTRGMGTFSGY